MVVHTNQSHRFNTQYILFNELRLMQYVCGEAVSLHSARTATAFVSVELMRRKYREFPALAKAIYSISANIERIDIESELRFPDLEQMRMEGAQQRGKRNVHVEKNIFLSSTHIGLDH